MSGPPIGRLPLRDLLARIAGELQRLRHDGRAVEDAIGRSILGEEPSTRETLKNIQGIDLMVQTLGELENLVSAVSGEVPQDQFVEVGEPLSRITLRDLARNLAGAPRCPVIGAGGAISGEVDLF